MELWNDFEGKTVDGRFTLERLLGPKGRSAYFTGKDEAGGPAVIRLIESLNDEDEILGRWGLVTGMKQEHLVGVLACGQTVLDGTHLVYAVMEPSDMELGDVLRERALSPEETRQIALSVADGLEALHAKGLVHEHVEADNVLAQGETVKLRSDVVREAPEGVEGAELRSRDVHDLAVLLLQCLTRSRNLGGTRLPGPFDEVVRKGESGAWGLKEIQGALRPVAPVARPTVPTRPAQPVVPPAVSERAGAAGSKAGGASPVAPSAGPAASAGAAASLGAAGAAAVGATAAAPNSPAEVASRLANQTTAAGAGGGVGAHVRAPRVPDRIVMETEGEPKRTGLLIGVAAGFILLVLLGLHFFRSSKSEQTKTVLQETPAAVTEPQQSGENRPPARDAASAPVPHALAEKPSAAVGSGSTTSGRATRVVTGAAAPSGSAQWRVVAFTYNREDQAAQKARAIAAQHPGLKPEVFSPSGRAPYLVTLGGWMSADQASSLRSKARSEGLPRDSYMQNYHGGR